MASGHGVRARATACDNQTEVYNPKTSEKEYVVGYDGCASHYIWYQLHGVGSVHGRQGGRRDK
jgi:hypothetical protein